MNIVYYNTPKHQQANIQVRSIDIYNIYNMFAKNRRDVASW